uniref:G_PROTEIN_RECEP_F1_2 domain-containing protein n=1 Tax=Caenorhabditis tropicalis TaxID=1561998 RepID=A0A1I7SY81_9PELO
MNRSWEEIFKENCGPNRLRILSISTSVALIPLTFLYLTAVSIFFKKRKMFHPLFSFCFLVLLLLYLISSIFLTIRNVTFSIYGDNEKMDRISDLVVMNSEKFYMAVNFFIPPMIAIGIIERIFATTLSRSYEKSRPWTVLGFGLVAASLLVYLEFSNRHALMATISTRHIQVLFAILCSCSLFILLWKNWSKSKSGRAKSALSERYQVNENLKALRIQIPVVCIDTAIQIMFLSTEYVWRIAQVLNLNRCYDDDVYLIKFAALRLLGFILQYFIPFIVLFHTSFICCNSLRRRPVKRPTGVSPSPGTIAAVGTIRNVIGITLTAAEYGPAGQEAHFRNLYAQWN